MMKVSLKFAIVLFAPILLLPGCASHPRDFIPNGSGANLSPTNPEHIQLVDAVPRNGMVIGMLLVNRAEAGNTQGIIAAAKQKAAAVGGDFIVWEDSEGTMPAAEGSPAPGGPSTEGIGHDATAFGHGGSETSAPNTGTFFHSDRSPKARFTVGILMQQ